MRKALRETGGFTLLEIIVVLAVVALLAAALTPMILTYLEDAKKAQAQSDVNAIAVAITAFIKDTKVPPYKKGGNDMNSPIHETTPGTDFSCLHSSDGTISFDGPGSGSWHSSAEGSVLCEGSSKDTIENQLITNAPGYATTGRNRWQGPYLPTVKQDPWGNAYLVNIKNANPKSDRVVMVLSPGPNNLIDTHGHASKTNVLEPGVDDILARVK